MNLLIKMSVLLLVGTLAGRLAKKINIPSVTGYLLGGILIGPSAISFINENNIEAFSFINDIALAAIAFSIGSEFLYSELKKVGRQIFIITVAQAVATIAAVFIALYYVLGQPFYLSLILSTIAAATAPAATTMIIKQYKSKGPLTRTILPVVAIDDAICVIAFGIAIALAKSGMHPQEGTSAIMMYLEPLIEIVLSLLSGFALGLFLTKLTKKASNDGEFLCMVLSVIILAAGLSNMLGLSSILTCMMLGATITNLSQQHARYFKAIDTFTPPIYLFFFTLAGANLHLSAFVMMGMTGAGYIIARSFGKITGSYIGCKIAHAPDLVSKNLGFTLLPQAGVAIGLAIMTQQKIPELGAAVSTVVLGGVLFFEVVGPIAAKYGLSAANEIETHPNQSTREVVN